MSYGYVNVFYVDFSDEVYLRQVSVCGGIGGGKLIESPVQQEVFWVQANQGTNLPVPFKLFTAKLCFFHYYLGVTVPTSKGVVRIKFLGPSDYSMDVRFHSPLVNEETTPWLIRHFAIKR